MAQKKKRNPTRRFVARHQGSTYMFGHPLGVGVKIMTKREAEHAVDMFSTLLIYEIVPVKI